MKAMVPASGLGEYSSGQLNEAQNRLEAALSDYNAALVKNPNAFEPLSGVVRVYVTQKKPALATARLEKIIQTEPKHVLAHNLLGEVQLLQGRYVEAEAALQEANRLAPKVVTTIRNLANVKLALKNVDGAEAVYREGLAATNHDVNLHLEFAAFYQRLDRIDPAIREYERLLEKHSGQPVASNNLAMLLVTHRHDKASVERASRLSESLSRSDNAAYLDTVGWVHYKRGQYDNAIHALEKAIAKAPKEPLLRYHLGMAYFGKGEPKMAQDHLKRAVESQVNFHGRDEAQSTLERIQSTS
jgi:tetratricopeptide (TPR) repeat protein